MKYGTLVKHIKVDYRALDYPPPCSLLSCPTWRVWHDDGEGRAPASQVGMSDTILINEYFINGEEVVPTFPNDMISVKGQKLRFLCKWMVYEIVLRMKADKQVIRPHPSFPSAFSFFGSAQWHLVFKEHEKKGGKRGTRFSFIYHMIGTECFKHLFKW